MRMRLLLSCLWLISSMLLAIIGWGLVGGMAASLESTSVREAVALFAISAFYLPLFAVIVVAMLSPPYAVVFLAWPWIARWLPLLEVRRQGLAVAALGMAIPAALVVAGSRASFAGDIDWREFAEWFSMATITGTAAILTPRLIWRRLAPGTFCEKAP